MAQTQELEARLQPRLNRFMSRPDYALTYPQLVIQAHRKGYDPASLGRLRRAHETALRLLDGFYRAQDSPFLCHLIRTASIAMEHGGGIDTTLVSLLHAVYMFGVFRDGKRGITEAHRNEIREAAGPEVDEQILEYMKVDLRDTDRLDTYLKDLPSLSAGERDALFIALSNELEDYLDLQMVFRRKNTKAQSEKMQAPRVVELACSLGHPALAEELNQAFEESHCALLPDILKFDRSGAYELAEHYRMRRGILRRVLSRVKRLLTSFLMQ